MRNSLLLSARYGNLAHFLVRDVFDYQYTVKHRREHENGGEARFYSVSDCGERGDALGWAPMVSDRSMAPSATMFKFIPMKGKRVMIKGGGERVAFKEVEPLKACLDWDEYLEDAFGQGDEEWIRFARWVFFDVQEQLRLYTKIYNTENQRSFMVKVLRFARMVIRGDVNDLWVMKGRYLKESLPMEDVMIYSFYHDFLLLSDDDE